MTLIERIRPPFFPANILHNQVYVTSDAGWLKTPVFASKLKVNPAVGHDYVYEFVPQNEIWVDDDIAEAERGYVILHELHERNLMAKGWTYDKAHSDSSRVEYRMRHHPDELHDALIDEGWA